MTQAGDARTLAGPCAPAKSQPVHPAHSGFAEESCDTGEGEGDEDPTAILSAKG